VPSVGHLARAAPADSQCEAGGALPAANGRSASEVWHPLLDPFTEIWAVDFEFGSEPGENPEPVCLGRVGITQRSESEVVEGRV